MGRSSIWGRIQVWGPVCVMVQQLEQAQCVTECVTAGEHGAGQGGRDWKLGVSLRTRTKLQEDLGTRWTREVPATAAEVVGSGG